MGKFAFHVEFSKITWGFIFNYTLFKDCKTSYIKFIDKRIQSQKTFLALTAVSHRSNYWRLILTPKDKLHWVYFYRHLSSTMFKQTKLGVNVPLRSFLQKVPIMVKRCENYPSSMLFLPSKPGHIPVFIFCFKMRQTGVGSWIETEL